MRSSALLVRLLCVAALARAQKRETWPHPGAYDLHKRVSSTNECDPNYQAGPSLWEWLLSRHRHGHGLKLVDKWTTYLPAYEAYLSKFRGCDVNILELGVQSGGSQEMWLDYFGPRAHAYGADVDERTLQFNSDRITNMIGDVGWPPFLQSLCRNISRLDVVLDDASHIAWHQVMSFEVLFPCLNPNGGVYIVEDLNANYFPVEPFKGGVGMPGTFVEYVKGKIDEMNAYWSCRSISFIHRPDGTEYRRANPLVVHAARDANQYKCRGPAGLEPPQVGVSETTQTFLGLHVHDGLIVVEKMPARGPSINVQGGNRYNAKHHVAFKGHEEEEAYATLASMKKVGTIHTLSADLPWRAPSSR